MLTKSTGIDTGGHFTAELGGLTARIIQIWDRNRKSCPFQISRRIIMQLARTRSVATYHKYLKELEGLGYIHYQPSFHPRQGSKVWLVD